MCVVYNKLSLNIAQQFCWSFLSCSVCMLRFTAVHDMYRHFDVSCTVTVTRM